MKRVNYMSAGLIAMTLAGVMLPITSVFAADEPIKFELGLIQIILILTIRTILMGLRIFCHWSRCQI